ncbi:hypothetical protein ZIOFF_052612 [Zingiber officinale]|uniref:BHLH domain-containing protein n=1 Tax=Zingiber officinale TaxID=94328 RepID=A0A8J5G493_ZINOF|nr:hypothetical protein ZIOFF_052612 [Zingiber officinale]
MVVFLFALRGASLASRGSGRSPLPSSPAGLRKLRVVLYSSSAVPPPCASPLRAVVRLLQVSKWLVVLGAAPEEKRDMDAAASRSSRGFEDEDDDELEFGRREGPSHKGDSFAYLIAKLWLVSPFSDVLAISLEILTDLTIKVDGKGSGTDDLPTTPKSKHSAMEQRRRNKINDRQILRELIPHSDQKRDKASFLLEVIEYIRFLQEKEQKYESSFPGWNQENQKPWNNNQIPVDGLPDPSQVIRNGSAHAFSGPFDEGEIPVMPSLIPNAHNPIDSDTTAGVQYKMESASGFVATVPAQAQSLWLGSSSPADCATSNEMLNDQEDLIIDEGTITASTNYSQGLLTTLTQALQSSGIDLSQASISVQINLRKRASNSQPGTAATLPNSKGPVDVSPAKQAVAPPSMVGNLSEESSQASKRLKAHNN